MDKTKETPREFCARIVKEFPDTFRTDKLVLFCNYCECPVTAEKLSHVKQHIATEKHKKKLKFKVAEVHRFDKVYLQNINNRVHNQKSTSSTWIFAK